jgi:hypothetical protein
MAMHPSLGRPLQRVLDRERQLQLRCKLAACWVIAAASGGFLIISERQSGWASSLALPIIAALGICAALFVWIRHARTRKDLRRVAAEIEARHPDLDGRLITAVQQEVSPEGELNYFQERLINEVVAHDDRKHWAELIPQSRLMLAGLAHVAALILFGTVLWGLRTTGGSKLLARVVEKGVTVSPGDVTLERGSSLVVVARFAGALPTKVDLVIEPSGGTNRTVPLVKSLADPMFGGSVPEVGTNLVYHIEYAGERTRDFKVGVFEYPRLERADADIAFPEYTAQPARHIKDTRRLSAVEGSLLGVNLHFNKPVVSVRLVPKGHEENAISLILQTNGGAASLKSFPLEASQTYDLRLVDAEGRTNKVPAQFVFEALVNRPPEIKLASPRGDVRPSALEEITFEGTVWDDFGVQAYGVAYAIAGKPPKFIELGGTVPAKEKHAFSHVLRLEDLGVEPDDLVSWYVWADDVDSAGKTRRTSGDMFFAEVRAFEEIFREGQGQGGGGEQQGGGQSGGQGDPAIKLAELQKQIVNATWKLQREHGKEKPKSQIPNPKKTPGGTKEKNDIKEQTRLERQLMLPAVTVFGQRARNAPNSTRSPGRDLLSRTPADGKQHTYAEDLEVVREAVDQAIEMAQASQENETNPRTAGLWTEVINQMEKAKAQLEQAAKNPSALSEAVTAAQAAYANLLKLQKQREYSVNRRRNRGQQSGSSREQQMQRQLEQMDLQQSEDRYEKQRQAQAPQSPERREQLQVMNRLQELARRQQDLNDRLKELQTALQEARTEQEREEIQRRLKRLQEEEQQMLADTDELRQRMDRPENQSRMSEQRQQLEQTRSDMQRAAEAASQGAASQALASGTRAQRQLQDLREQLRKQNSSQFSDDLRQMRADARELARQQDDLLQKMQNENRAAHKSLSDSDQRKDLVGNLSKQGQRLTNLLERATQISQEAETAEPVLSRQLYDTVRKFSQDSGKNVQDVQDELLRRGLMSRSLLERLSSTTEPDASKLMETTAELVRQDFLPQAAAAGQQVRPTLENLKRGVERAAESVLGDDTEALRLARQELDQLMDQLQSESAAGRTNGAGAQTASAGGTRGTNQARVNAASQGPANEAGQRSGQTAQASSRDGQTETEANEQSGQRNGEGQNSSSRGEGKQPAGRGQGATQTASAQRGQRNGSAAGQGNESQSEPPSNPSENSEQANQNPSGQPGQDAQGGRMARNGSQRGGAQRGGARTGNRNTADGGLVGGNNGGYTGGPRLDLDRILNPDYSSLGGPLTGENFVPWSDRLREVEEMLDVPDLRNSVANARERARVMRQEYKKDLKKPDWAVVRLQVINPLVEVRDRIAEELARRESTASLVPIDRDPVPNRYSDLVRRYYEELGKDK